MFVLALQIAEYYRRCPEDGIESRLR